MRFDKPAAFQIQSIAYKSHYENVPFEIPESWCWTTLGELFDIVSAKRVLQSDWQRTGIPFYRAREIVRLSYEGYVDNDLFITEEHYNNLKKSYGVPEPSDIMLSAVGTIGRAYVVRNNDVFYYKDASVLCLRNVYHLNSEFIKWILSSDLLQNQMYENSKGTTVDTITIEKANNYFLPLPPIAEQYRIVKLLCKWDAYINDINKNKEVILNNIRTYKSKVLDLAISGKLVPQDPNDEPAIELLKRINPNFQPCDNSHYENLPQGWAVCHLEDVCQICDNQRQPINSTERQERKKRAQTLYPYYGATGQVDWIDDYMLDGTFILLGEDGAPFLDKFADKAYVVSGKIWVNNHAHILKPNCDITYLTYYLNRYDYSECVNGSTRLKLTQADMKNMTIVLPPLVEQHRIAGRVENIFRMLEAITAEL